MSLWTTVPSTEADRIFEIINCVNVLVGGSAVFTALTGMNDIAAVWLLPVGVVICTVLCAGRGKKHILISIDTLTGGIKATFLTDYIHTIIIYAMTLTGLFVVYARSNLIGSIDEMYELLKSAAVRAPVTGNAGGEYGTQHTI